MDVLYVVGLPTLTAALRRRARCSLPAVLFAHGVTGLGAEAEGISGCVQNEPLDAAHARPHGVPDTLVEANGTLCEALERIERARGALYAFHQLMGGADAMLDEVVDGLRATGHPGLADRIRDELVGLNVVEGRWTFQLVEEFDDGYYATFRELERAVREETMAGRRHVFEAEMKQRRRTESRAGHEATPTSS